MAEKNQPARVIRFGRIKAVVWKNEGADGNHALYNTTVARLYKGPGKRRVERQFEPRTRRLAHRGQSIGRSVLLDLPPVRKGHAVASIVNVFAKMWPADFTWPLTKTSYATLCTQRVITHLVS